MNTADEPHVPHFMPGGTGSVAKYTEEEEIKQSLKVSKFINEMDEELKNRFKALKAIQDAVNEFDKEEQKEIRILEVEFEKKYKEIYAQRELIINGKMDLPKDLIEEFGVRVKEMQDEDYAKLEVTPCDVKSIQNIPKGVSDFWIKAMLNHPAIA